MSPIKIFFHGAVAMSTLIAAAFFLRFWKTSSDRLFLFFAAAFAILSIDWGALALLHLDAGVRHYVYVFRLVAFALIIAGVVDKNRRGRRGSG